MELSLVGNIIGNEWLLASPIESELDASFRQRIERENGLKLPLFTI